MLASPPKRRRIESSEPSDHVGTSIVPSATNGASQSTPKRASFQSPTKASLAKFNPTLLPPATAAPQAQPAGHTRRRSSVSRGESLVQQVLGGKRRASQSEPQTSIDSTSEVADNAVAPPNTIAAPEELSTAITRAFMESRPIASRRSPLRSRQASAERDIESRRGPSGDTGKTFPTHSTSDARHAIEGQRSSRNRASRPVQTHDFFDTGPSGDDDDGEPELPPTPTQLGISPQPDRPRGLALSSSPSGRRARRAARDAAEAEGRPHKSSPLKPHNPSDVPSENEDEALESGVIEAAEIVDAQNEETELAEEDLQEVHDRLEVKRSLKAQLLRLQGELKQIESLVQDTDDGQDDLEIDESRLNLLTTDNPSCLPPFAATNAKINALPSAPDLPSAGDASLQYLNLFAPGNLNLSAESATTIRPREGTVGDIHQVQTIRLAPPSPFPAHVFELSLIIETNVTQERVVRVELFSTARLRGHEPHLQWINSRLNAESEDTTHLHAYDAGTLVYGTGLYWNAIIERARIFHALDNNIDDESKPFLYNLETPDKTAMKQLLPYLTASTITLTDPSSPNPSSEKVLHLSYTLHLDWTGEIDTSIEISGFGLGNGATQSTTGLKIEEGKSLNPELGIKQVFEGMRKTMGVLEAVRGVRKVVFGQ